MKITAKNTTLYAGQYIIRGYKLDIPHYYKVKQHKLNAETTKDYLHNTNNKQEAYKQAIKDAIKPLLDNNTFALGTIVFYIQSKSIVKPASAVNFVYSNGKVELATKTGLKALDDNIAYVRDALSTTRTTIAEVRVPKGYQIATIAYQDKKILISDYYNAMVFPVDTQAEHTIISNRNNRYVKGTGSYLTFELAKYNETYSIIIKDKFKNHIVGFYTADKTEGESNFFKVTNDKGQDQLTFTAYIKDKQVDIMSAINDRATLHYLPKSKEIRFHTEIDGYEATAYAQALIDKTLELDKDKAYLIGTFKTKYLRDAVKYGKLNISLCKYDEKGYNLHKKAFLDYDIAVMPIDTPYNSYFGNDNAVPLGDLE